MTYIVQTFLYMIHIYFDKVILKPIAFCRNGIFHEKKNFPSNSLKYFLHNME